MTTYLHFDLGSNRDAYQQVLDEIRRHSAKPSELVLAAESSNHYTIAAPIHMKSELETLVSSVGRLAHGRSRLLCAFVQSKHGGLPLRPAHLHRNETHGCTGSGKGS